MGVRYTAAMLAEILSASFETTRSWTMEPTAARELERSLLAIGAKRRSTRAWEVSMPRSVLWLEWNREPQRCSGVVTLTGVRR